MGLSQLFNEWINISLLAHEPQGVQRVLPANRNIPPFKQQDKLRDNKVSSIPRIFGNPLVHGRPAQWNYPPNLDRII